MMKGQGQLGPMLTLLGMKPVKFLSDSEFLKSVTTESKLFSIYAVGVVRGYKRETRTSIHAVVDFRDAPQVKGPSLGSVLDSFTGGAPSASASASAVPTNTAYPMTGSGGLTTGPITAATAPNSGGQLIFYHIESTDAYLAGNRYRNTRGQGGRRALALSPDDARRARQGRRGAG